MLVAELLIQTECCIVLDRKNVLTLQDLEPYIQGRIYMFLACRTVENCRPK